MRKRTTSILPYLGAFLLASSIASADERPGVSHMEESEIDARLQFLENRLTELRTPSSYWQHGWTGFYGVSTAAQLYGAIDEDNNDDSTVLWVGAIKSAGGLAMTTLKPLPVMPGLPELTAMPTETREQKLARLKQAEQLLTQSVRRADERFTWKPHLITVGANLVGAAAIAAFGDSDDALGSAALGIAIGEAALWTQPAGAEQYWQEYQQQFNGEPTNAINWRLVPGVNSIALQARF